MSFHRSQISHVLSLWIRNPCALVFRLFIPDMFRELLHPPRKRSGSAVPPRWHGATRTLPWGVEGGCRRTTTAEVVAVKLLR